MLYQFALLNSSMEHFELMIILVLPHICEVLPCQIFFPLVFTKILNNKDKTDLRRLDIICNEKPIDVIDRFIQASGITAFSGD